MGACGGRLGGGERLEPRKGGLRYPGLRGGLRERERPRGGSRLSVAFAGAAAVAGGAL
jgi:hypothetical protein